MRQGYSVFCMCYFSFLRGGHMFIDTHAHFDICSEYGIADDQLFENNRAKGLGYAVQVATEAQNFDLSLSLSEKYENIYCALGIHPSSENYQKEDISKLRHTVDTALAESKKIIAIGEVGLDYHWMEYPKEEQFELFEKQIALAKERDLFLIIHSRDAFEDTFNILKKAAYEKVIIHCFSGDSKKAKKYLDLGFYISFAGNVTFKKALELQDALRVIPDNSLLLETDSPFLTPVPFRGKKNMPAYVEHVYRFAAEIRNSSLEKVKETIFENFKKIIKER